MKLPNAQSAIVTEQKIADYLLNPAHPVGGGKARFFLRFGFRTAQWQRQADALLRHACENEVAQTDETIYGRRYIVEGTLAAPDGSRLNIRRGWYIDGDGDGKPRFVTAHPLPKL